MTPPTTENGHAQRALELIRLTLEGETAEAGLLFDTVQGKDYLGLAAAAIATAVTVCEAAGREFSLAVIEDMQEVL